MTSIRDGYSNAVGRMAAAMTGCNKCGTVACENLAKQVAHAWLKANNIPEGIAAPTCKSSTVSKQEAAALIAIRAEKHCLRNSKGSINIGAIIPFGNWLPSLQINDNDRRAILNAQCYSSAVNAIVAAKARGDCNTVERQVESAGVAFATQYGCDGIYSGKGCVGGKQQPTPKSTSTPTGSSRKPTGPDADCYHWGGDWFGGFFDGFCVAGKSLLKGGSTFAQDPVGRYMPLFLLGGGLIMVVILLKK